MVSIIRRLLDCAGWLGQCPARCADSLLKNATGIVRLAPVPAETGLRVIVENLPCGTKHLMVMVRFERSTPAVAWPHRAPVAKIDALAHDYEPWAALEVLWRSARCRPASGDVQR